MKTTTAGHSKRVRAVGQREWSDTSVALPPPENLLLERLATTLSGGIIVDALERALLEYLHRAAGAGSTRGLSTKLDLPVRRRSARSSAFNLKTLPIELPMPHDDSTLGDDLLHLQTYLWVLVYAFESKQTRPRMQGQYFLSDQTYLALMRALLRFPGVDDTPSNLANDERPLRSELPKKAVIEKERRLLRVRLGKNVLKAAQQRMTRDRIRGFSELVRRALREKAARVGLDRDSLSSDARPAFTHYPNPQLVEVQPNLEEPALAVTAAVQRIARKLTIEGTALPEATATELRLAVNTVVLALRRP